MPRRKLAIFAVLVDKGVSIRDLGVLTDRQIVEIYFHPRDDKGQIRFPSVPIGLKPAPETVEECLLDLAPLRGFLPPAEFAKAEKEIKEKYEKWQSEHPSSKE